MLRQQSSGRTQASSPNPAPTAAQRGPAHQPGSLAPSRPRHSAGPKGATGTTGFSEDCFLAIAEGVIRLYSFHQDTAVLPHRPDVHSLTPSLLATASSAGSPEDTSVCLWQHWACRCRGQQPEPCPRWPEGTAGPQLGSLELDPQRATGSLLPTSRPWVGVPGVARSVLPISLPH